MSAVRGRVRSGRSAPVLVVTAAGPAGSALVRALTRQLGAPTAAVQVRRRRSRHDARAGRP
ncbi:MAG TPA: hypothetical protein VI248_22125 [Kineosporiaceae bacterium]